MGCGNSKKVDSTTKKKQNTSDENNENSFLDKNIPKFFIEEDDSNTLHEDDSKSEIKGDTTVRILFCRVIFAFFLLKGNKQKKKHKKSTKT